MKQAFQYLSNLYKTNTAFHSLITGLEGALVSVIVSYSGGIPTNKAAFLTGLSTVGAAAWGVFRKWLIADVVTAAV